MACNRIRRRESAQASYEYTDNSICKELLLLLCNRIFPHKMVDIGSFVSLISFVSFSSTARTQAYDNCTQTTRSSQWSLVRGNR